MSDDDHNLLSWLEVIPSRSSSMPLLTTSKNFAGLILGKDLIVGNLGGGDHRQMNRDVILMMVSEELFLLGRSSSAFGTDSSFLSTVPTNIVKVEVY